MLREIAPGFHYDFPGAVGDLVEENRRLKAQVADLTTRLNEAHAVLAGYNAQPCGPRTAFVLGFTSAGGSAEKAAESIGVLGAEKRQP